MIFFLKLSFRNIFRQKRRSLFTILSIMGSFVLCSVAIGLVYGTYGKVINTFTRGHAGHISIMKTGFFERPSLFKNVKEWENIIPTIEKQKEVISYSPRVISSVLASVGDKTTGARMYGINPELESKTTTILEKIKVGQAINTSPSNEIILSHALSKILNVTIGSELILMTQAADGSMANDTFNVVGIFNEESDAMEARNIYVHIQTASDFLVLGSRVHEVVLNIDHFENANEIAKELKKELKDLDILTWQELEPEFYKAMKADQTGIWIDLGIMIFIVCIGVLNTVLMTILERTREFGILKAIGTRPHDIFKMVVMETSMLALVSISLGTIFALIINYQLSQIGIPYPMPIEIGGMALHHLHGEVSWFNIWVPTVVVFFSSVGVSLIPAMRAANIVPVKAIRSY